MLSSPLLNRLYDKLELDATSRAAVATRVQNNTAIAKALYAVSDDVAVATALCITFVLRLATTAAQVAAIIQTIDPSLSGNQAVKVFQLPHFDAEKVAQIINSIHGRQTAQSGEKFFWLRHT